MRSDFMRFNFLRNVVKFKQIKNCIKILTTYLENHLLQNKYSCEVKTTEQAWLGSTLT